MSSLTLALLLAATNAPASELSGSLESAAMEGVQAHGISWTLQPGRSASTLRVRVARATVDGVADPLTNVLLECRRFRVTLAGNDCADGSVQLDFVGKNLQGSISWRELGASVSVSVATAVLGGRVAIDLELEETSQRLTLEARELSVPALLGWLQTDGDPEISASAGTLWLNATASPDSAGAGLAELTFGISGLSFDSSDGTRASAGLALSGEARVELDRQPLEVRSKLKIEGGEALYAPIYVAFDELPPLVLDSTVGVGADGALTVSSFAISDAESLTLSGTADIDAAGELRTMNARIEQLSLPLAFERYLSAAAGSYGLGFLRPSGALRGSLQLGPAAAIQHATIDLQDVSLEDSRERFLIENLNGVIDYDAAGESQDSQLSWQRLGYYALGIRAADARFFIGGRQFRLLDPVFAPVLDGGLQIDELAIRDFGLETLALDFQGKIQPIDLELITRALQWPLLRGALSGDIPRIRLQAGVGEVGGAIRLAVFDGEVTIDNVKLERVFGVLPTLAADVDIRNVDLERITGAFSFGKITGRLDGRVHGLRMLGWQPVAFDLELATPEGYRGKRKISQRAVENLSSLGGGAAALSATFLRFFDTFSYRRLGLKCVLADNVCRMSGLAPAGRGFYIVEGAGVPRINIIGFSAAIDWPRLIRRLKAATSGAGPTVD